MLKLHLLPILLCALSAPTPTQAAASRVPKTPDEYIRRFEQMYTTGNRTDETLLTHDPGPKCLGDQEIPTLIAMTRSAVADVRRWAIHRLGTEKAKEAIPVLVERLKDKDTSVRNGAVYVLGELGDKQAVDALLEVVAKDAYSGGNAAKALGKIGDPRVVEPLIRCLAEMPPTRRADAAWALGRLGDKRAIEPILAVAKDPEPAVRRAAAESLGLLKATQAVELLIAALLDSDREVRQNAAISLGRLGDKRAVPTLLRTFQEDDQEAVQAYAAEALGAVGDRSVSRELLPALASRNPLLRAKAAKALHALGDAQGLKYLITALKSDHHEWMIPSSEYPVRDALADIGADAVPALIEALDAADWTVVKNASCTLKRIGKPAADALLATLQSRKEKELIRARAAYALGEMKEERAVALLSQMLSQGKPVGGAAGRALARMGPLGKPALLKALAQRGSLETARNAVIGTWDSDDPAFIPPLVNLLSCRDKALRDALLFVLRLKFRDPRVPAGFARLLEDPDSQTRRTAALDLATYGTVREIPALQRRLKRETDPIIKQDIQKAINVLMNKRQEN